MHNIINKLSLAISTKILSLCFQDIYCLMKFRTINEGRLYYRGQVLFIIAAEMVMSDNYGYNSKLREINVKLVHQH
jgi:hypothetical protein